MRKPQERWAAVLFAALAVLAYLGAAPASDQVKAWEDRIVIPTYEVGLPEPDPIFYSGRAYQGAKGPIYPYALIDKLSDVKRDRTYRILYLENEYVRVGVLPEIGGRIFEAVDKTNGYDFVYRQHVIKPALIGMLGAWISGGVEWNIPHHHRATSFMPVDSALVPLADGSATIWIGEIELRHRMRWLVGLTLRPGSSVLEVTTRIINRTPFAHSMLAFANVAVHTNESYQVLFPPSTEIATFHGKNQFSLWPVSTEVFNGQDYTKGVDVSWWKNHRTPTSFFAFDAQEDFLGGYDHGRQAGVVFIADHGVAPGKKLWTWGTGSEGKTWERILTDADGPYLELMIGAWSDNQPDYSWIKPGEERSVSEFWYPIRGVGGLKNANREAACNLEVEVGRVRIAFHATSERKRAQCVLRSGEKILFEDTFDIGPGSPYAKSVEIGDAVREETLELALRDADGKEILRYAPRPKKNPPLPKPVTPPAAPKDIPTNEELYLVGLRLEQFHNPVLEPYPYYEEALRRDPSDVRVNTAMGLLFLKRGLYREAEERFDTAVARLTANYTRPKDGEALYYLGVARRRLGKLAEAEDAFEQAAWDPAWQGASFFELAGIASAGGDLAGALEFVDRALAAGPSTARCLVLKATLLRRLGRLDEADNIAGHALAGDPLDAWARHEKFMIQTRDLAGRQSKEARESWSEFASLTGDRSPDVLEVALDYADCGLWQEARSAAWSFLPGFDEAQEIGDPLAAYLAAYALDRAGSRRHAGSLLNLAARMPSVRVFPHALEFIDIFEWAMKENPADARAPYYLGNLLFDLQPERAIAAWEKARERDPSFAIVHRNLGLAYARVKNDLPAALASLEKAVALDPKDARAYFELDQLAEAADVAPEVRLARFERSQKVVAQSDNALAREVGLYVRTGRAPKALEILRSHHFHVWEGGGEIHGIWVEANLAEGRGWFEKKDYRRALAAYQDALSYPSNLDIGPPSSGPGSPKIFFHIGQAQAALNGPVEARSSFEKAVAFGAGLSEQAYYRGLALRALGRSDEALSAFAGLAEKAREALAAAPSVDFFEKFGERQSAHARQANLNFLTGLGLLGSGKTAEARAAFERAASLDPGHIEARRLAQK